MTQPLFWTRHTLAQPRMVGSACLISLALACSPDPEPSNSSPEMDQGPGQVDMQVDPPGPDAGPGRRRGDGAPRDPGRGHGGRTCPRPASRSSSARRTRVAWSRTPAAACSTAARAPVRGAARADSDACGPCDLGRLTCGDDETGAGTCVAPETGRGGSVAACDQLLYVQEGASAQLADGTVDFPYPSMRQALEDAEALEGPALVLLAGGPMRRRRPGERSPPGSRCASRSRWWGASMTSGVLIPRRARASRCPPGG